MRTILGIDVPKVVFYLSMFLLVLAAGLFAINQFRLLYLSSTDPVTFHGMIIDPSEVVPGDPIFVTATLTRHRYCKSERDEFVADVATNTNWWQGHFANGSTAIGYVKIRNRYEIPVLPVGEYVLRVVAFYQCGDGDTHAIHGPEARFRIVSP